MVRGVVPALLTAAAAVSAIPHRIPAGVAARIDAERELEHERELLKPSTSSHVTTNAAPRKQPAAQAHRRQLAKGRLRKAQRLHGEGAVREAAKMVPKLFYTRHREQQAGDPEADAFPATPYEPQQQQGGPEEPVLMAVAPEAQASPSPEPSLSRMAIASQWREILAEHPNLLELLKPGNEERLERAKTEHPKLGEAFRRLGPPSPLVVTEILRVSAELPSPEPSPSPSPLTAGQCCLYDEIDADNAAVDGGDLASCDECPYDDEYVNCFPGDCPCPSTRRCKQAPPSPPTPVAPPPHSPWPAWPPAAPGCLRVHKTNLNDWYSDHDPPGATADDCAFLCSSEEYNGWCVAHEFNLGDNGSCKLYFCERPRPPPSPPAPRCERVVDTDFDRWQLEKTPPRKATQEDCSYACWSKDSVHSSWCVGYEFVAGDKSTCKLFDDCSPPSPSAPPPCMDEGAANCEGEDDFPASLCPTVTEDWCNESALVRRACRMSCKLCALPPSPPPPPRTLR
eukprot:Transcript_10934.p1 GENE.Transcript_10934~~Transcript_10934.p1  ORF type:complete len:510 (-),score=81.44 Transcript_10934:4-1533(-)